MKTVTREMIKGARTYMPLREKQNKAEVIAQACVRQVHMRYRENDRQEFEPMPDRYQVSQEAYSLCMMQVLVRDYLKQGGDENVSMPENEYDQWGESHLMNQLERMKFDKAFGQRVFDLLYDFKDFRFMVNKEIEILLGHENDVVTRLAAYMNRQTDPEALQKAVQEMKRMSEELQAMRDKKE